MHIYNHKLFHCHCHCQFDAIFIELQIRTANENFIVIAKGALPKNIFVTSRLWLLSGLGVEA